MKGRSDVEASVKIQARQNASPNSNPQVKPTKTSMSSPLSVKRRRVEDNTTRLAKPFRSPLRSSSSVSQTKDNNHNLIPTPYLPSTLAHSTFAYSSIPETPTKVERAPSTAKPKSTPVRKQHAFATSSKRTDPDEFAAQRAITKLELQIRSVKNEVDALKQANQVSSTDTDAELEILVQKWRIASQTAAEELFGTVKERVNRMGGVAAWRESEKNKYDRSNGIGEFKEEPEESDDADCEFDSQGEELPEDEQEYRKAQKKKVKQEMMDAADVEEPVAEDGGPGKERLVWQEPGGDDDVSGDVCVPQRLANAFAGFYDGYDASITQYRAGCHRLR